MKNPASQAGCSRRGSVIALSASLAFCTVAFAQSTTGRSTQPRVWQDRDTPATASASDQNFLDLLRLDGSVQRPELREVADLVQARKPIEAVDRFSTYFMNKLRYPARYGISPEDVDFFADQWPRSEQGGFDPATLMKGADELLNNKVQLNGTSMNIGEPGSVNWDAGSIPGKTDYTLHTAVAFTPLMRAYLVTKDQKYLAKWIDFMDDWCLNDHFMDTIHPCDVPDSVETDGGHMTLTVIRFLSGVAHIAPSGRSPIPPRVLAEILLKYVAKTLPYRVSYTRSNTHNWTPWTELLLVAQIYDEFKASAIYLREERRRNIEDNAVTQNLRDGTENQQDPWYNAVYVSLSDALRILQGRSATPGWAELQEDLQWKKELSEHLKERVTYQIHLRTAQGEWPIVLRGDDKRIGSVGAFFKSVGQAYLDSPAAFQDPVNLQILQALNDPASGVHPPYTSEWFPYGGFNIVRDGWAKDSGGGSMFCSPTPGSYGAYRSRSNNNALGIDGYGQDLLVDDTQGHYMYPSSPITVDALPQFFHAGVYQAFGNMGHKHYQVSAWTEPADWRWHASDKLNLMEGIYSGPWANPNGAPGGRRSVRKR